MNEQKKIIIISKNKSLARLCEIEANFCGFSSFVSESSLADVSKYSLAVVDIDTADPPALKAECEIVGITSGNVEENLFEYSYVLKNPFLLSELRNILYRFGESEKKTNDTPAVNEMTIYADMGGKEIIFCGRKIGLSEYEFRVLECLCRNSGLPVSREELSEIFGAERGNIAEVYICHLRKKLEGISHRKLIHTVRSVGYMTDCTLLYY